MATVHPSRLGLVPQASSISKDEERYSSRDRQRGRDHYDSSTRRDDSRERGRNGYVDRQDRRRSSSPPHRDRRPRERDERPRRRSPDYSSYRRDEPPHIDSTNGNSKGEGPGPSASAPWRAPENMYAARGRRGHGAAGGEDYFARQVVVRFFTSLFTGC